MMSVKSMVERYGVMAEVYRKVTNEDAMGYLKGNYGFLKTEKILMKKPSDAWGVESKTGNLVKRENITFFSALDTQIQEGDRLIINLEKFIVLKVSKTKEYSLIYLDGGGQ